MTDLKNELPPAPAEKRGRGRPPKPAGAISDADRARAYRARLRQKGSKPLPKIDATTLGTHEQFDQLRKDMASMFAIAQDLVAARLRGTKVSADFVAKAQRELIKVGNRYRFL